MVRKTIPGKSPTAVYGDLVRVVDFAQRNEAVWVTTTETASKPPCLVSTVDLHCWHYRPSALSESVGGVAQWLEGRSLVGGLSLIYA